MILLVTLIHAIVCLFLIIVVLLQSGKAADLAGAFGGQGSQTAFGPRGSATVLSKSTTIAACLFMVTSLTLSILHTRQGGAGGGASILEKEKGSAGAATQQAPAAPKGAPAPGATGGTATSAPAGQPVPVEMGKPGDPVAPGQPSVTLETETGQKVGTIPLKINPPPTGAKGQPVTPPAPAKK
jgi:preprotein translocase subunit SecG